MLVHTLLVGSIGIGAARLVRASQSPSMDMRSRLGGFSSSQELRSSEYYPEVMQSLPQMGGKAVAVTGASRGLGLVTARSLARKGALVYMLTRKSRRAERALDEVAAEAAPGMAPQLVECDLSTLGVLEELLRC